jgi:hypothetical protein
MRSFETLGSWRRVQRAAAVERSYRPRQEAVRFVKASFAIYLLGVLLWLVYGMMMNSIPLMISNAPATFLAIACIATKWKSDRTGRPQNSKTARS